MSFSAANLTTVVHGTGTRGVFFYATDDTLTQLKAASYFNNAANELTEGSLIMCSYDEDGTPGAAVFVVAGNTGSAVTVTLSTATADA